MTKKGANVLVTSRQCGNNTEKMIRRFVKKCKKEKIIEKYREKKYYKKPSIVKKEKRERAHRQREREKQKRIRAEQRRNRRKR